ncbi:DUF1648 domain-containing protein [Nonomuraea sp. NN258]|uniref:DUF1648 domain-containing protein n=1 Tax=Nonomuraea antri TaxID=2730852 RepID=UPI00156A2209|nr:DUF1648 domain-containing protein [Nonomuraea antri]NRQ38882.1 DUF1648 domain-containing protein [Nonomuraea antri]
MISRLTATVWGLAVTAVLVLLPLSLSDRLPDPIATHWGAGGAPDGSMSQGAALIAVLALWSAIWLVLLGIALWLPGTLGKQANRIFWWASLFFGGALVLGMSITTVLANLDAPGWAAAELAGWQVLAVIAAALAAGALAGYAGRGTADAKPAHQAVPAMSLRPGQRTVWVSRVSVLWPMIAAGVAAAGIAVTGALWVAGMLPGGAFLPGILPVLIIVLAAGLVTGSVSVRVSENGLAIGFGPFGRPGRHIPLSQIESAWAEDRQPGEVGGWGFRGLPGNSTIMVRGGDCLVVRYRSGRLLAVSADDAERGAALVNALVEERIAS